MGRNKFSLLLYIIVGLAVIGLVSSLINNPGKFLLSILIGIAIAYIIYQIFTRILNNRSPATNDEMKKYRKAAKLSNQKYHNNTNMNVKRKKTTRASSPVKSRKRRRNVPHLTIIEGRKSSKEKDNDNDRASN